MKAKLVEKPPATGDWIYELKFDGIRLIAIKDREKVSLLSRNQNDLSARFPEIVDAVGSQMEIMFDGGVRSGQDVMRALALGAKSCMIGRAYVHGLGGGGEAGVAKAIDLIRNELLTTMALCGVNTIAEIDDSVLAI